jgi:hypothetical protein
MPLKEILKWMSRATGIGYNWYDPMVQQDVDVKKARDLREKADKLAYDVERLERELRQHGRIRILPPWHNGD